MRVGFRRGKRQKTCGSALFAPTWRGLHVFTNLEAGDSRGNPIGVRRKPKAPFFPSPLSSARFLPSPPSFRPRQNPPKLRLFLPISRPLPRRRPHLLCRGSIAILLMETPGYEGGIGGKLRRRPLRRAAATPYDRPPTAARGLVVQPSEPEGSGWLAKLVDPASRLITSSASKLFSSVFRKRLPAPSVDGPLGFANLASFFLDFGFLCYSCSCCAWMVA
ncbi:hypothetical protein BHE74_00017365 [Ensete ventricosum]|nr:hypothetical protein BHE74_00017365 [Ensete ventricosum]